MSVDVAWDTITSGPDGEALAERIREFIHDKFQEIALPRFIKSVHVHSFHFGDVCPKIDIKDVVDPFPDFYEDDYENEDNDEEASPPLEELDISSVPVTGHGVHSEGLDHSLGVNQPKLRIPPQLAALRAESSSVLPVRGSRTFSSDSLSALFPRAASPGIPGGTSNMSYFHLPVGGLSGTQTPLAAVAGGSPFPGSPWYHELHGSGMPLTQSALSQSVMTPSDFPSGRGAHRESISRFSNSNSVPSPIDGGSPHHPPSPETRPTMYSTAEKISDDPLLDEPTTPPPVKLHPSDPMDLQVIAHVSYSGDIRMTLTAEILLDYPMPSFVGIPLKLSITGMTFDGVAVLAYIKKRMHFCFLDPEDAAALVNDNTGETADKSPSKKRESQQMSRAGILREIRVESEIGRQEGGKQVLKNVGKVEKFVLEQVRRIFEEEFVFPSFWTLLV